MKSLASRYVPPGRRRVVLGAVLSISLLLVAFPPTGLLSSQADDAPPITVPQLALPDLPIPDLPSTADLQSVLDMLPVGQDLGDLDLTKGEDIKKVLASLPVSVFNPTFKLTDTPGSWYDSGLTLFGGKSLAVIEMLPGIPTSVKFVVGPETGTDTGHTATSLIRPVGAANIDQAGGFVGEKE